MKLNLIKVTILLIALIFEVFTMKAQNNEYVNYFKESYTESRKVFREKSEIIKNKYQGCSTEIIKVPSKTEGDLTVDVLFIPPISDSEKLLIISSGVHGIEGYTGHAVQSMFFDMFISDSLLSRTAVLFIHSVNPYGFKYNRRVTENNIDLNRNSSRSSDLYKTINEGYPKVEKLVNPKKPVNLSSCKNRCFFFRAIFNILKAGMPALRQAILQGQYQYPKGLYYGGQNQEPQIDSLKKVIENYCSDFKTIFAIDLHTGYGERGKLHLFPNPVDETLKKRMEKLFDGYQIDWADSDDFYTVTGDFVGFVGEINKGKTFIPMTFEYGTLNTQKTSGSIKSIKISILENQGMQYGYKADKDSVKVRKMYMEMFFPSSEKWRIKTMEDTENMLKKVIPRFCSEK